VTMRATGAAFARAGTSCESSLSMSDCPEGAPGSLGAATLSISSCSEVVPASTFSSPDSHRPFMPPWRASAPTSPMSAPRAIACWISGPATRISATTVRPR
jgi:hypothetical protein